MANKRIYDLSAPSSGGTWYDQVLPVDKSGNAAALKLTTAQLQGEVFNVKAYGAVGDGSAGGGGTDDTAAVQAAISAAAANDIVLFPEGTYRVASSLTLAANTVTLQGTGKAVILGDECTDILQISGNSTIIRNLDFEGDSNANGGDGISVTGYGLYLENVRVSGVTGSPIMTSGTWSVTTVNCLFDATGSDTGEAGYYHGANSNNVLHLRSRFVGGADCIGADIESGAQIAFIGCDFSGGAASTATGIDINSGYAITIRDCYFEYNGSYGVRVGSSTSQPVGVNIVGNWFNQNDIAGNIGVSVEECYICRIDGNTFLGNSTGTEKGIYVESEDQGVYHLTIGPNNYIYGVATTIDDTRNRADSLDGHRIKYGTAAPTDGSYYADGDIIYHSAPAAGGTVGWVCTTAGAAAVGMWTTATGYTTGDYVVNSQSKVYRATTTGTSGATEPTHDTGTASDNGGGGVTWQYVAGSQGLAVFKAFGAISA